MIYFCIACDGDNETWQESVIRFEGFEICCASSREDFKQRCFVLNCVGSLRRQPRHTHNCLISCQNITWGANIQNDQVYNSYCNFAVEHGATFPIDHQVILYEGAGALGVEGV